MSMSDPVADFLTHIRNALMRNHATVESPSSKTKVDIAKVLKDEGFIEDYLTFEEEPHKPRIQLTLKYDNDGGSIIRGLKRISRPGLRAHCGYQKLTPVFNGQGVSIVTTSKGVITDFTCREQKIGGEVLCEVW